jgi:hypothetical protein
MLSVVQYIQIKIPDPFYFFDPTPVRMRWRPKERDHVINVIVFG